MKNLKLLSLIAIAGLSSASNASNIPVIDLTNHPEKEYKSSKDLDYEEKQFPCSLPLNNGAKAAFCLEHKFKTEVNGLYHMAQQSEHLGNTNNNCTSDLGQDTYFSDNQGEFRQALNGIEISSCQIDTLHAGNHYRCIGTTSGPACYRKGQPTTKIAASIDSNTGQIISFYPTKP